MIKMAEVDLKTKYGTFHEVLFYDGQKEAIAFYMGDISEGEDVLCRVHSSCIHAHIFNSVECECREEMAIAQQLIQKEGCGIVIWLEQEGKGNGHYALLKSIPFKRAGMPQAEAYEAAGFQKDARDFSAAAKILKALNIKSITMLTNNQKKVNTLTQHGITISGTKSLEL
ncbi:GTP cyclohydrolase [uncultured Kordia sp.]|uniref:GTP cyclohydrolase n=1 Tax=uncultured Kordia sp. TaxID=507699 RepID=UPI002622EEA3|nr:GTP cyclohydrolase [uncultured Kordia sp.]